MVRIFALIGVTVFFTACSSVSEKTLDYSLANVFSAIEVTLSMGIQRTSENHREFYSRPFIVKQDPETKKEGYRERGTAKVWVLGDSRPYTVEVEVSVEKGKMEKSGSKEPVQYSHDHYDKKLAGKLLSKILGLLDRRRHDNNIIDDFKPF